MYLPPDCLFFSVFSLYSGPGNPVTMLWESSHIERPSANKAVNSSGPTVEYTAPHSDL